MNKENWYLPVDMQTGNVLFRWVDSLSAFWPGLQVLNGDIESAKNSHLRYYQIWDQYGCLPERYDLYNKRSVVGVNNYPLRFSFD